MTTLGNKAAIGAFKQLANKTGDEVTVTFTYTDLLGSVQNLDVIVAGVPMQTGMSVSDYDLTFDIPPANGAMIQVKKLGDVNDIGVPSQGVVRPEHLHANAYSSQAEARAGVEDTKLMTPAKVKDAIDYYGAMIGVIQAWFPGYFSGADNGGAFINVLGAGASIAEANSYLRPRGWAVCDGTELNDPDSPIFNGAGRFLPNLTDDRFLAGGTTAGGKGGSNVMLDHTHLHVLTAASGGSGHDHTMNGSSVVVSWGSNAWVLTTHNAAPAAWQDQSTTTTFSGGEHAHTVTGTVGTGSAASVTAVIVTVPASRLIATLYSRSSS